MTKIFITDIEGDYDIHRTFYEATNNLKSADSDWYVSSSKCGKNMWLRKSNEAIYRLELPISYISQNHYLDKDFNRIKYLEDKDVIDKVAIKLFHISKVRGHVIVGILVDGQKMYVDKIPYIIKPSQQLLDKINDINKGIEG